MRVVVYNNNPVHHRTKHNMKGEVGATHFSVGVTGAPYALISLTRRIRIGYLAMNSSRAARITPSSERLRLRRAFFLILAGAPSRSLVLNLPPAVGVADDRSDALPDVAGEDAPSGMPAEGCGVDALTDDLDAAGVADMRSAALAAVTERPASVARAAAYGGSDMPAEGCDVDTLTDDLDAAGVADMRSAALAAVTERPASVARSISCRLASEAASTASSLDSCPTTT
jgi:hypothetical protein